MPAYRRKNLESALRRLASHARDAGIITDVDGTISPIASTPGEARVSPQTQSILAELAGQFRVVALLSGRGVGDMQTMVSVSGVVLIGNHGMEWLSENGRHVAPEVAAYEPDLRAIAQTLNGQVDDSVIVELKGLSVSLHYRQAADPTTARERLLAMVTPLLVRHRLRLQEGRRVVELRPDLPFDKGTALTELVEREELAHVAVFGDDHTDVAAFKALDDLRSRERVDGFSVGVVSGEVADVAEAADFQVRGPADVVESLRELLRAASASASLS